MHRSLISMMCLVAPVFTCCRPGNENNTSSIEKPNVILFLIDDFGYADIGYEGNKQIRTPNIDRIANGGSRFTRFYQSSAASAPTRASLLTGRYHLDTGVWDVHDGRDFIRKDEVTIADALNGAGYVTGAFGKWHSGKTNSYFSWSRGFDIGIHPLLYNYMQSRVLFNNKLINTDGPVEDVIGDEVIKFIESNKERPFFAYVPVQSVHEPFNCPKALFEKYKSQGYSDHVARLYGMIELLDKNIGKILDTVEKNRLDEKTLILFMSDDGPSPGFDLSYSNRRMNENEQGERSRAWARILNGGKASIYEGGQITPFYIMWKGKIPEGKAFNELAGIIDIYPTILEICNVPVPENNLPLAGKSLWPILNGKKMKDWDERYYYDNTNFYFIPRGRIDTSHPRVRQISVHHKNFKLIRFDRFHEGNDTVYCELYDLEKDPMETNNIASLYPKITQDLRVKTEDWFESILLGGRAYKQAVYEIGNWAERGTPVNLDSYENLFIPDEPLPEQTSFSLENWSKPGSFASYNINVTEKGMYMVELEYSSIDPNPEGEFLVFTEHDTANLKIEGYNSSVSEVLNLPAGKQLLTIKLTDPGKNNKVPSSINSMIINRIPESGDISVIRSPYFSMEQKGGRTHKFFLRNDVADFMFGGIADDTLIHLDSKEPIIINASADNPEQISSIYIYKNFDLIREIKEPSFIFELKCKRGEKFTLNVEFESNTGIRNSVRAYLQSD